MYPAITTPQGIAMSWNRSHPKDDPLMKAHSSKARTPPKTAADPSTPASRCSAAITMAMTTNRSAKGATANNWVPR